GLHDHFFNPVSQLPAGRVAGTACADAPRVAAVLDDLIGQGDEVVPSLRNLVTLGREGLGRVPDGGLDVLLVGDAPDLAVLGDQADRRMGGRQLGGIHERRYVDDLATGAVGQDWRRLGQLREVRRVAAVDARLQHGLVARADAVDLDLDAGSRGI